MIFIFTAQVVSYILFYLSSTHGVLYIITCFLLLWNMLGVQKIAEILAKDQNTDLVTP